MPNPERDMDACSTPWDGYGGGVSRPVGRLIRPCSTLCPPGRHRSWKRSWKLENFPSFFLLFCSGSDPSQHWSGCSIEAVLREMLGGGRHPQIRISRCGHWKSQLHTVNLSDVVAWHARGRFTSSHSCNSRDRRLAFSVTSYPRGQQCICLQIATRASLRDMRRARSQPNSQTTVMRSGLAGASG